MQTSILRLAFAAGAGAFLAIGCPASAQPYAGNATVIELFTSQGCSSCPPADALFKLYASRPDIVALSMPVDYWDYLGWKDTLANGKFTQRQRSYAQTRGDGQVYTPQVIINGHAHFVGSSKADIEKALEKATEQKTPVRIKAILSKGVIEVDLAKSDKTTEMTVWLAVVQPQVQVEIKAGENRGRKLVYHNVVRDLVQAGTWNGDSTVFKEKTAKLNSAPGDRYAVIVQNGRSGDVAAASWIEPAL